MPIIVSNEGWVKVPPKPGKPRKPVDPVDILRGPLAYITGRPEFKEPVKKQSIKQLLLEAAPLPPPVVDERLRSHRSRNRVISAPVSTRSKHKPRSEIFEEVDEEIIRPELQPDDSQSRRSASPAASRHTRAAPSVRSRRHEPSRSVYDDDQDGHRHNRSRRQVTQSVYRDDHIEPPHHRSGRSDRSERDYREYRDYRERERYYPHTYAPQPPQIQPIVIYPQQSSGGGCGGHHHSCQGYHQHQYQSTPRPMIEMPAPPVEAAITPALIAPRPAPSEVSSRSSGSTKSRAMSYKWYTATQPLAM